MAKTVALVNCSVGGRGVDLPPIGSIYLGSALRHAGYQVRLFHPRTEQETKETVQEIAGMPDLLFVGFTVFMGMGSLVSLGMMRDLKARRDVPIAVGGAYPSSLPDLFLNEPYIDAVCVGEGERAILEFAENREPGILRAAPVPELDSLNYDLSLVPDWCRYLRNVNGKRTINYCFESQRGCPFRCGFCYHSKDETKQLRWHSIEWVIEKVRRLREMTGVEAISFCDDEFWLDQEHSFQLLEKLREIGVTVHKLRMRFTDLRHDDVIRRIENLGINSLIMGLESGSDRMLQFMRKGLTTEIAREKIGMLNWFPRIQSRAPIMLGCPTETKAEARESVRFALKLTRLNPRFQFSIRFYKPVPGSVFYDLAVEHGFKPPTDLTGWAKVEHGQTHHLGSQWLPWFNDKEKARYEKLVEYLQLYQTARSAVSSGQLAVGSGQYSAIRNLQSAIRNSVAKLVEAATYGRLSCGFVCCSFADLGLFKHYRRLRGGAPMREIPDDD